MKAYFHFFLWFVAFFSLSCGDTTHKHEMRDSQLEVARVVKIIDGDTYDLLIDGEEVRIRMDGIDAPERGQDFYKKSKEYLGQLCMGQEVRIEGTEKDRWGRLIAKTYNNSNQELGQLMVAAGMAWHFKKYSNDTVLSNLEIQARNSRIGLWSIDNPTPPWEKRKANKTN